MRVRRFCLLPLLLLCFYLSCSAQSDHQNYSVLNGNWHLGGTGAKSIDFTFGVDGNTIYGEGYLGFSCKHGTRSAGFRGDVVIEGPIAADGSFVLSNPYTYIVPENVLTIHGRLPGPGSDQWSGGFALSAFTAKTSPSPEECEADSGDFTATRLPDLRGVYTGSFGANQIIYRQNPEIEGYVSLEITQGELTATSLTGMAGHVFAANGKITITGSSKINSGAYTSIPVSGFEVNSKVYGGRNFRLQFLHQSNGTNFTVDGETDKADENRLHIRISYVTREKDGKFQAVTTDGWLTRIVVEMR